MSHDPIQSRLVHNVASYWDIHLVFPVFLLSCKQIDSGLPLKDKMSPTPTIPIPTIDPSRYAWYTHPTIPGLYQRCALGLETKWVHQSPQNRQIFLSGMFTFRNPMSSPKFRKAAVRAWLKLRFEFPEVVLRFSGEYNADGSAIMESKIPTSETEADEWVTKTLYLGDTNLDVETQSSAESQIRMEVVDDPVCARLNYIGKLNSHYEPVVGAEFCFRVDHQLADGMGVYILAGNFLKIFAKEVSRDKDEKIEWEKAVGNIPEPWVLIMNAKQKTEGKGFEERVTKNVELVLEATVCPPTFCWHLLAHFAPYRKANGA